MKNMRIFYSIGKRLRQEDSYLFFTFKDMNFFLLMDGHGYEPNKIELVTYLRSKFKYLIEYFFKDLDINEKTLSIFFKKLDKYIYTKGITSGVCLTLVIKVNKIIYVCTLGDVGCIIYDDLIIKYKNIRHTFDNINEVERYKKFNLEIFIQNKRYKGLKVSRSLGNGDLRTSQIHPMAGVPNIDAVDYTDKSKIILFTDGILEHFMECELATINDIFSKVKNYSFKDNTTLILFDV